MKKNRALFKIELTHVVDISYPTNISESIKTYKFLGIVVARRVHHYPRVYKYEILTDF